MRVPMAAAMMLMLMLVVILVLVRLTRRLCSSILRLLCHPHQYP